MSSSFEITRPFKSVNQKMRMKDYQTGELYTIFRVSFDSSEERPSGESWIEITDRSAEFLELDRRLTGQTRFPYTYGFFNPEILPLVLRTKSKALNYRGKSTSKSTSKRTSKSTSKPTSKPTSKKLTDRQKIEAGELLQVTKQIAWERQNNKCLWCEQAGGHLNVDHILGREYIILFDEMEHLGYLVGLGRSFTTSVDNAMLLHVDRHNALDSQVETECLLLPDNVFLDKTINWLETHDSALQTADRDLPIRNLTTICYGVSLERWEMRTVVFKHNLGLCKPSYNGLLKSRYHPPIVFALKAALRMQNNNSSGYPIPEFSNEVVSSDGIDPVLSFQLKVQKVMKILDLIQRGFQNFKIKHGTSIPRPIVNNQTAGIGEGSTSGNQKTGRKDEERGA